MVDFPNAYLAIVMLLMADYLSMLMQIITKNSSELFNLQRERSVYEPNINKLENKFAKQSSNFT